MNSIEQKCRFWCSARGHVDWVKLCLHLEISPYLWTPLVAIAAYADEYGVSLVTRSHLLGTTLLGRETLDSSLRKLVGGGYLSVLQEVHGADDVEYAFKINDGFILLELDRQDAELAGGEKE